VPVWKCDALANEYCSFLNLYQNEFTGTVVSSGRKRIITSGKAFKNKSRWKEIMLIINDLANQEASNYPIVAEYIVKQLRSLPGVDNVYGGDAGLKAASFDSLVRLLHMIRGPAEERE
jgi:hypothetical protein